MLIVAATAAGGALLLWNMVVRTKHVSEEMLVKYGEMLAAARTAKAKKLAEQQEQTEEDGTGDPIATSPAEEA